MREFLTIRKHPVPRYVFFLMLVSSVVASACTSTQQLSDSLDSPRDPWEGFNRSIYGFNDTLDQALLTPAATGYRTVAPEFVETGISNFFANLDDVNVAFNNALQLKFPNAASDVGRVIVNSTAGVLGFFDVASHMGLQKHDEDFGQTLGYWGVGSGPYLMLPFFGPSSLRDAPAKGVDMLLSPERTDIKTAERNALFALQTISKRAELMQLEEKAEEIIHDRYIFIRDIYMDRREFLVKDGEDIMDDDFYEESESE